MAKADLPIYVSIGGGTPVQAGVMTVTPDDTGTATLTLSGMAKALRDAADVLDEQAKETPQ